jgi:hypothetical protein
MMSFVAREMEKLNKDLCMNPTGARYAEIFAAQQALAWALDPMAFKAPSALLICTQASSTDCSVDIRRSALPSSSDPTSDAA